MVAGQRVISVTIMLDYGDGGDGRRYGRNSRDDRRSDKDERHWRAERDIRDGRSRRDVRDADSRGGRRRSRSPRHRPTRAETSHHKVGGLDLRDGSAADRERMLKQIQSKEAEEERKRVEEEHRAIEEGERKAKDAEQRKAEDQEEEDDDEVDQDTLAMQQMMGFGGFDSTKGKKVSGNEEGAAKVHQPRTYRQYMNRVGGFNRALDKPK
ncbi:hypothetical protein E3P94_03258 [Wallemia ichthyophaga]|nr:hypothetical protein E3P95_03239 [Wallemia ichthyophaga]TIA97585.1 hypothetical protein E3P94_03258 [Wallemia ichthyophaga]